MFAKKDKIYNKNSLPKIVSIILKLLNDTFEGINNSHIIEIIISTDFNEYEKNILKILKEDDSDEDSDDDTLVIDDYSLLIIHKIRFANIIVAFNSKHKDISDCNVNTYDIRYVNKYLAESNGKLKKLNTSTIKKINSIK